jgi:nucleotide-binding universal stress UspA family protein
MKNILLLTDFSDTSKNAIRYALKLFKNERCTFYVMYVQDATSYTTDDVVSNASTSLYDSLINKNRIKLATYVSDLKSEFDVENFKFKTIVDFDSIIAAIHQSIKAKDIDLIVMGTNGATGAKEIVFGSNTLKVIRRVDCTTLIIPQNFEYVAPKQMLLALDQSDQLNGEVIADFFKFLKRHSTRLHVLRVNAEIETHELSETDKNNLNLYMTHESYLYDLVDNVPMEQAVDNYIQTNHIDMLSLIVQKESFLERLFAGSSTTKINQHTQLPLLIFHS